MHHCTKSQEQFIEKTVTSAFYSLYEHSKYTLLNSVENKCTVFKKILVLLLFFQSGTNDICPEIISVAIIYSENFFQSYNLCKLRNKSIYRLSKHEVNYKVKYRLVYNGRHNYIFYKKWIWTNTTCAKNFTLCFLKIR